MLVTDSVSARETGKHADERAPELSDRGGGRAQTPGTERGRARALGREWEWAEVERKPGGEGEKDWAAADCVTRPRAGGSLSFFYFPNPFCKKSFGQNN